MEIRNMTAVVTGAGRGIGRALALEFARLGANVVCAARSRDEVRQTAQLAEQKGGRALAVTTDVTRRAQVERMVDQAHERFGQIDVLINNAGAFRAIGPTWEVDPEVWWSDVATNLLGAMLCCRAVLPRMIARDEGVIVNLSGGGAATPLAGGSGYGSSKAALLRLTDTLAAELENAGSRVMVFAMAPGLVRTAMTEHQAESPEGLRWLPQVRENFERGQHRPPEDCARATVQLLRIACPELSGRAFSVTTDFDAVLRRQREIKERGLYTLRLRV